MRDTLSCLEFAERGFLCALRELMSENGGTLITTDAQLARTLRVGLTSLRAWRRQILACGPLARFLVAVRSGTSWRWSVREREADSSTQPAEADSSANRVETATDEPAGPLAGIIARFMARPEVSRRDTPQKPLPSNNREGFNSKDKPARMSPCDTGFTDWLNRWVPRHTRWQFNTYRLRWRTLGMDRMWHVAATWAQERRGGYPLLTIMLDEARGVRAASA